MRDGSLFLKNSFFSAAAPSTIPIHAIITQSVCLQFLCHFILFWPSSHQVARPSSTSAWWLPSIRSSITSSTPHSSCSLSIYLPSIPLSIYKHQSPRMWSPPWHCHFTWPCISNLLNGLLWPFLIPNSAIPLQKPGSALVMHFYIILHLVTLAKCL